MSRSSIYEVLGRHPVHPFPARMAPGLALAAITELRRPATVLDPMAGSGTVLAIARATGHRAIGFDVDPLAVLIARVWTRTIDIAEVRDQSEWVVERARECSQDIRVRDAYPAGADMETRAFVRYWFDDYVRRQLAALALAIGEVASTGMRDVLWCAFSRQIIAKQAGVSLARDLSHSRPHRSFVRAPRKPLRIFEGAVERVIEGCIHNTARIRGPITDIRLGDVRLLPVPDESIDLAFTSPPYLNAIDYLRCSKFSLVWMGYSIEQLRSIRSCAIGTEVGAEASDFSSEIVHRLRLRPGVAPRTAAILNRYINDIAASIHQVKRVLKRRGRAVYVVGENTIRGTFIPTGRLVALVAASAGLHLVSRSVRSLPTNRRYLPPPGAAGERLDTRMRREVVLMFERPRPVQRARRIAP